MHFIIVLTSLITTHEAQSPIGGGSWSKSLRIHRYLTFIPAVGPNIIFHSLSSDRLRVVIARSRSAGRRRVAPHAPTPRGARAAEKTGCAHLPHGPQTPANPAGGPAELPGRAWRAGSVDNCCSKRITLRCPPFCLTCWQGRPRYGCNARLDGPRYSGGACSPRCRRVLRRRRLAR